MQHNNTTRTNRLIAVAQKAVNANDRDQALYELWDIYGKLLAGTMAKKAYQIDSDFDDRGDKAADRRRKQGGNAYIVFHEAVMSFDPSKGVPFAAYVVQKGNWRVEDDKRENSRRCKYQKSVDFSLEGKASSMDPCESEDLRTLREARDYADTRSFDEEMDWKEAFHKIDHATERDPRLHKYIEVCRELRNEDCDYSDAEVGRRMGCSRANVGVYKKKLIRLVREEGLLDDLLPAA
jgi:hypothetical protein